MRCSHIFLSHRRISPFSRWFIFTRARVRSRSLAFARSTIPEEKWRLLVVYPRAGLSVSHSDLLTYYSLLVERQPRSQGPPLLIPRSEKTLERGWEQPLTAERDVMGSIPRAGPIQGS